MIKEAAIALYLFILNIIFNFFSLFPIKNKTVMLTSFGDNMEYLIEDINAETQSDIFVLKEPRCKKSFSGVKDRNIIQFSPKNLLSLFKGMYHLATGKYIFIDNYHVVLAACNFRKDVTCTQLWHANGAVKYFGWRDKTIASRPDSAYKRFEKVYSRFHNFAVSSDEMAYIFGEAFNSKKESMLKTGMPRTDFFYNTQAMRIEKNNLYSLLPQLNNKKVLLYAPTFRDNQLNAARVALDLELMKKQLGENCHLLLKLHPAVELSSLNNNDFVTDVSSGYDINALLTVTDILITDYSSIPFEFSILNKPMIFFSYDLDDYKKERGIWFNYETYMPGPVVFNTQSVISVIQKNIFDMEKIKDFNKQWNKYSDGSASKKLVEYIYNK